MAVREGNLTIQVGVRIGGKEMIAIDKTSFPVQDTPIGSRAAIRNMGKREFENRISRETNSDELTFYDIIPSMLGINSWFIPESEGEVVWVNHKVDTWLLLTGVAWLEGYKGPDSIRMELSGHSDIWSYSLSKLYAHLPTAIKLIETNPELLLKYGKVDIPIEDLDALVGLRAECLFPSLILIPEGSSVKLYLNCCEPRHGELALLGIACKYKPKVELEVEPKVELSSKKTGWFNRIFRRCGR